MSVQSCEDRRKQISEEGKITLTIGVEEPKIDGVEEQEDADMVESPHFNIRFYTLLSSVLNLRQKPERDREKKILPADHGLDWLCGIGKNSLPSNLVIVIVLLKNYK